MQLKNYLGFCNSRAAAAAPTHGTPGSAFAITRKWLAARRALCFGARALPRNVPVRASRVSVSAHAFPSSSTPARGSATPVGYLTRDRHTSCLIHKKRTLWAPILSVHWPVALWAIWICRASKFNERFCPAFSPTSPREGMWSHCVV